eukprot:CAMPEP_0170203746 /NCGR_PEP_ID=MMETSP0116_2-20130129/1385_1 /TAXON_ID=400756 /ORGANISM="Durinskia baltica, Strain CSIRO CS-38" /LENGTH=156 /DNA_ID=CAMNT_0010454073 /DNA_START=81 /DNA_END=548 /DNA_ORIENTATION=-
MALQGCTLAVAALRPECKRNRIKREDAEREHVHKASHGVYGFSALRGNRWCQPTSSKAALVRESGVDIPSSEEKKHWSVGCERPAAPAVSQQTTGMAPYSLKTAPPCLAAASGAKRAQGPFPKDPGRRATTSRGRAPRPEASARTEGQTTAAGDRG